MSESLYLAWREGAGEFNCGRYWEAHERWERGWKGLPEPERTWVQGWIQLAGALHLASRRRHAPAARLAASALSKLRATRAAMSGLAPRLEVEGGFELLESWREEIPSELRSALKASLLPGNGL